MCVCFCMCMHACVCAYVQVRVCEGVCYGRLEIYLGFNPWISL